MRKPAPRTLRKIKRKANAKGFKLMEPGIHFADTDFTFTFGRRGSRVEKLPPYGEYNPNRVHVARRRKAHKENKAFPRGWKMIEEIGESYVSQSAVDTIVNGGWLTSTKVAGDEWIINGTDII